MLEQPGSGIETTKHANLPKWKQRMLETCIEDDGSFNVGLYRGLRTDISVRDYMDIQEALTVHRDRTASFRTFIENVYREKNKTISSSQHGIGAPIDMNPTFASGPPPESEGEATGTLPVDIPISVLRQVFPQKTDDELEAMARFQAREIAKARGESSEEMGGVPGGTRVDHLFSKLSNGEWGRG